VGRGWDGVRATDGGEGENNILNEYTEADTDNESTPPATSNLYPIEEHYKSRPSPFLSPSPSTPPSTPPAIQITDVAAQQYYQPPAPADQKFTHHIGREWGTMPKTDLPPGSLAGAEGSSLCYVWRTGLWIWINENGYDNATMMNYRGAAVRSLGAPCVLRTRTQEEEVENFGNNSGVSIYQDFAHSISKVVNSSVRPMNLPHSVPSAPAVSVGRNRG
jgi:hypothetical protein